MTEQPTDRTGAAALLREIPEGDEWRGVPCCVRAKAAGGPCRRPSVVRVYDLPSCEEHGAECKGGALEELYGDADLFFERLEGECPSAHNPEALRLIQAARLELDAKCSGHSLIEHLEWHREHVAAQLAYTLLDSERKWASAKA